MATGIFIEINTAGDTFTTSCAAGTANTGTDTRQAEEAGGAAGAAQTVTMDAGATDKRAIMFTLNPAATDVWAGGTWTVRLNVTTTSTFDTWVSTFICRVNSGGASQATIGSLTGQSISLGTAGTVSMAITGSAQTPAAGDKIYIVLGFTNSSATKTKAFGYTPNVNIDSPLTAPVAAQMQVLQALYRGTEVLQ